MLGIVAAHHSACCWEVLCFCCALLPIMLCFAAADSSTGTQLHALNIGGRVELVKIRKRLSMCRRAEVQAIADMDCMSA